jgi:hypothetical protein
MSSTTTTSYPQTGGKLPSEHDGFAIASLVTAFFVPILGIIFGHLSNRRAKLAHRAKSGLAVTGLVLGYLFTAVTTLIIVVVVAAVGSATSSVSADAAPPASSAPASDAAPAASGASSTMGLALGQSVTVNEVLGNHGTVTTTGAQLVTGPQTELGSAPAHGHFVIVTVKATAASGGQLDINPLDFYAKAAGQHFDSTDGNAFGAIDSSQELSASTLNSGESATGQIAFDVPSAHGQIVYAPGLDSQAVASWNY